MTAPTASVHAASTHVDPPGKEVTTVTDKLVNCPECGEAWERCPECRGDGKGHMLVGNYGECPMCSGDGDIHECSPFKRPA